jgi:hypothetical protein
MYLVGREENQLYRAQQKKHGMQTSQQCEGSVPKRQLASQNETAQLQ